MTIKVTREQVAAAKIVQALDNAEGRQSDEWITRLVSAEKRPQTAGSSSRNQDHDSGARPTGTDADR